MTDTHSNEAEFLRSLVAMVKPEQVVTSGVSAAGVRAVAEAQKSNGFGNVSELPPGAEASLRGAIDMLLCAGGPPGCEAEIRRLLPQLSPHGLVLLHHPETALRLEREGLLSVVLLPTPGTIVLAQKRAARG
jgi:hypothetical protein